MMAKNPAGIKNNSLFISHIFRRILYSQMQFSPGLMTSRQIGTEIEYLTYPLLVTMLRRQGLQWSATRIPLRGMFI